MGQGQNSATGVLATPARPRTATSHESLARLVLEFLHFASSGESVGKLGGLRLWLSKESVELSAGGVEGALLFLAAMMNQWASVGADGFRENAFNRLVPEGRRFMQVTNDLAAQGPKVVHVIADRFAG